MIEWFGDERVARGYGATAAIYISPDRRAAAWLLFFGAMLMGFQLRRDGITVRQSGRNRAEYRRDEAGVIVGAGQWISSIIFSSVTLTSTINL
jgi:hypothetical protein